MLHVYNFCFPSLQEESSTCSLFYNYSVVSAMLHVYKFYFT